MTGLLLIQLGTPDAPTPEAVKPYLRQFLSDPRVIEVPRWKWRLILNCLILRKRPAESAAKYARIWDPKTGSPLLHYTKRQTELLQATVPRQPRALRHDGRQPAGGADASREMIAVGRGPPHRPADVPAILRDHHRQRHRRPLQGADEGTPRARAPRRAAVLRPPGLPRRGGRRHPRRPGRAPVGAGALRRQLPRHPAELRAEGRPLRHPRRPHHAGARQAHGLAARAAGRRRTSRGSAARSGSSRTPTTCSRTWRSAA